MRERAILADAPSNAAVDANLVVFDIEGMTWGVGCVKSVEEALASVPCVSTSIVDFDTQTVSVMPGDGYSDDKIVAAISAAGDGETYKATAQ